MNPIPFTCPNPICCKRLQTKMGHAGRTVRCHGCGTKFRLERSTSADGSECLQPTAAELPLPPPPAGPVVPVPAAIGRFRVTAAVGRGSFGVVYRAHDPELDREVAVKVPRAGTLTTSTRVKRFLGDAKAAARLRHPHIVPVFDVGEWGGGWFIASAFVNGRTLAEAAEDGLPLRTRVDVVRRLADALDYAHGQGVVHRDVKPLNVMLDEADLPHLIDFGLAKLGDDREDGKGAAMGTGAYMSPEQAAGRSHEADANSDQYSLGVTLYELLGGRVPFTGPTDIVRYNVVHTEPPPLHSLDPTIPLDLVLICRRAMAKNSAGRYASCREFADDLRRWLDGETPRVRVLTRRERLVRWVKKDPKLAGAVGLAAAAVLLAAALGVTFGVTSTHQARALAAANADLERSQEATASERDRANEYADQAAANAKQAAKNERTAQKALASAHYDRAVALCEQGEIAQGMNWFVEAIRQAAEAGEADLERAARLSLSAWAFEQNTVARVLPLPFHPKAVAVLSETAAVAAGDLGEAGYVALFNPRTGRAEKPPVKTVSPVRAVAVLHGGRWFATADEAGTVRVWNADATPTVAVAHLKVRVNALAAHPTENRLLAGCDDGFARLITLADEPAGLSLTLTEKKYPHERGFAVHAVAFHPNPDTPLVLTGSGVPAGQFTTADHLGEARQFHADTAALYLRPVPHAGAVRAVAYRPDGQQFATATGSTFMGEGRVWETDNPQPSLGGVFPHIAEVNAVGYDPRGRFLLTAGQDRSVWARDAATFRPLGQPMRHAKDVRAVAVLGDRVLAVGDEDAVRIWDLAPGPAVAARGAVDGPILATTRPADGLVWVGSFGVEVRAEAQPPRAVKLPPDLPAGPVRAFDARADRVAATGGVDGKGGFLALFTSDGSPAPGRPTGLPSSGWAVGLSRDAKRAAVGCDDGRVGVWEWDRGEWAWQKADGHDGRVYAAVFSPDGSAVLTCGRDNTARLWDASTGRPLTAPITLPNVGLSAAFTDDGKRFLVGYAGGCRVFEWAGGNGEPQPVGADLPHQAGILFAAVDADGGTALTGGTDGRTRWWDLATGKPVGPGWGMSGLVRAAKFVGGGRVFVADTTHRSGTYREYALPAAAGESLPALRAWVERATGMALVKGANGAVAVVVIPPREWKPGDATAAEVSVAAWRGRKPAPPPVVPVPLTTDPTPAVAAKPPVSRERPTDPPPPPLPEVVKPNGLLTGWTREDNGMVVVVVMGEKDQVTFQAAYAGTILATVVAKVDSSKGNRWKCKVVKAHVEDVLGKVEAGSPFEFDWVVKGEKATLDNFDSKINEELPKILHGEYAAPPKAKPAPPDKPPVEPKPGDPPKPAEKPPPPDVVGTFTHTADGKVVLIELRKDSTGSFTVTGAKGEVLLKAELKAAKDGWWVGDGRAAVTNLPAGGTTIPERYTFAFVVTGGGTVSRFECGDCAAVRELARTVNGDYRSK